MSVKSAVFDIVEGLVGMATLLVLIFLCVAPVVWMVKLAWILMPF